MPSRNIIKLNVPESYYHVYARGASKWPIFLDPQDYEYFLKLLARYLSSKPVIGKDGLIYPNYRGAVDVLAYCLMGNHFHFLLFQQETGAMTKLMRSVMTSYSRYFNLRYKRTGSLFESRYKASRIDVQAYLEHISRYIHLNPRSWKRYKYSSLQYYMTADRPEWINPTRIEDLFQGRAAYLSFLDDYEDHKEMLDEIRHTLANS